MKNSEKKLLILEDILDSRGQSGQAGAMSVDIFDDGTYDENRSGHKLKFLSV